MFKRFLKVGLVTIFILGSVSTLHAAAMPWIQLLLLDDGVPSRPPTVINVPLDYNTIQEAIDSAINGDQIVVALGTYQENINFKGKAIKIESSQGPGVTTIDGNNAGSVVTFSNGEGRNSQIEGFSIINGTGTTNPDPNINNGGGGILCLSSSPTIKNNLIYNCTAGYGGGILSTDVSNHISSPEITGNTIYDNSASNGAGIFCNWSSPDITGNTIRGNNASGGGGIACWHSSSPAILNNRIYDNIAGSLGGGGIRLYNLSESQLINNTVYGNSTSGSGGALYVRHSMPTVKNSIFWNNDATGPGDEIWVGAANMVPPDPPPLKSSDLEIDYSDVQGGNTLPGVFVELGSNMDWDIATMINTDPDFFDDLNGDFHLRQDPPQPGVVNPCVNTGDPVSAWQDGSTRTDDVLDSGIVDMGFHYTD